MIPHVPPLPHQHNNPPSINRLTKPTSSQQSTVSDRDQSGNTVKQSTGQPLKGHVTGHVIQHTGHVTQHTGQFFSQYTLYRVYFVA